MVITSVVRPAFGIIGGRAVSDRSDSPRGLNLNRRICPSGPHVQTTWRKGGKGRLGVSWLPMVSVLSKARRVPQDSHAEMMLSQSRNLGLPSIGSRSKSIGLLGRLVLVDQVIDAIIGGSECSLPWCSMSGPLQAISPECCPEIVELALPELVSPMQVPARKAVSVDCV